MPAAISPSPPQRYIVSRENIDILCRIMLSTDNRLNRLPRWGCMKIMAIETRMAGEKILIIAKGPVNTVTRRR